MAERHGDGVRDPAEVAHERVDAERLDVPAHVVQDRHVAEAAQARGEVVERRLGRDRRLADERSQRPQRLDVAAGR